MSGRESIALELEDIQSGVLRPRPAPYAASYILLRIDERGAGRELMRRAPGVVASAADPLSPLGDAWVSVALTFQGFKALGIPDESLNSFAPEFQQGMAARVRTLGDFGESSPENWEPPLGTPNVHIVLTAVAPGTKRLEQVLERGRKAYDELKGIRPIWRQDCHALPTEREPFGFKDGISHPAIEGSGIPGSNPKEQPFKAGEFVLGYRDETGGFPPMPQPEVLGRNGTYAVFRKLRQDVAAFRRYLKANSSTVGDEELLAAKMMGRWRSGAPLALSPERDNPALGADATRNNDFSFADDPVGLKTPAGSHIRRANPRDASVAGAPRLHRMIRRGTVYGPPLPEGMLTDDGVDRGIMFAFIGAHIKRQFEFVQSEWMNDGVFIGSPTEKDPVTGANDGTGAFTQPRRPVRRRLQGLPRFVITRGGEYCFMPSLAALRWLGDLKS
jgi:Dyp-type peroxidase family